VQPAATASSTIRSGVSDPSEHVECRCKSITAPSVPPPRALPRPGTILVAR
jgi:hypothetical protein